MLKGPLQIVMVSFVANILIWGELKFLCGASGSRLGDKLRKAFWGLILKNWARTNLIGLIAPLLKLLISFRFLIECLCRAIGS